MSKTFDPNVARACLAALFAALVSVGCATHAPPEHGTPAPPPTVPAPSTPEHTAQRHAPPTTVHGDPESRRCLALTMYWEARGEGRLGMQAVGAVVLNRAADSRFPNNVCGVIYQGGEKPPCQFSWWCDGRSDRPTQQAAWNASLALAGELLDGTLRDPTHGALYFSRKSIRQPAGRIRTALIGDHAFYR